MQKIIIPQKPKATLKEWLRQIMALTLLEKHLAYQCLILAKTLLILQIKQVMAQLPQIRSRIFMIDILLVRVHYLMLLAKLYTIMQKNMMRQKLEAMLTQCKLQVMRPMQLERQMVWPSKTLLMILLT